MTVKITKLREIPVNKKNKNREIKNYECVKES